MAEPSRIVLVCASDDHYAMPLAAALHSVCRNLSAGHRIKLYLLDGGLSPENRAGLDRTLAAHPIEIERLVPDPALFDELKVSHYITHTAYFRLQAAELLPANEDKAIYLDADLLVVDDLAKLWSLPLGDHDCLAAVDIACPFLDARIGCSNFKKASPFLNAFRPIPNYRELGLRGEAEYFNSGVMVLNLGKWRREGAGERLLRCLREHESHLHCWDQYALNVVFARSWGRLPPHWNQGAHVFDYPSRSHSPIDVDEFVEMRDRPAVVHFTTRWKPWHYGSTHPSRELFFAELDRTAWRGWRPERRRPAIASWWERFVDRLGRRLTISYRTLAALWA